MTTRPLSHTLPLAIPRDVTRSGYGEVKGAIRDVICSVYIFFLVLKLPYDPRLTIPPSKARGKLWDSGTVDMQACKGD
jgi:hypothetical protein